jgi:hypothetical protein
MPGDSGDKVLQDTVMAQYQARTQELTDENDNLRQTLLVSLRGQRLDSMVLIIDATRRWNQS